MTVQLFKTIKDAKSDMRETLEMFNLKKRIKGYYYPVIARIKFDERDKSTFGMRGFTFNAINGENYYIVLNSIHNVEEFNEEFKSKMLKIVY